MSNKFNFEIQDSFNLTMDRILSLAAEIIEEFSYSFDIGYKISNEKLINIEYNKGSTMYYFEFEYEKFNE